MLLCVCATVNKLLCACKTFMLLYLTKGSVVHNTVVISSLSSNFEVTTAIRTAKNASFKYPNIWCLDEQIFLKYR